MLSNVKGKQNTNGFAKNPENINRKGRPIDAIGLATIEALKTGDIRTGTDEVYALLLKKGNKLSVKDLLNIERLAFARYYYMTGGDIKKYLKVTSIR